MSNNHVSQRSETAAEHTGTLNPGIGSWSWDRRTDRIMWSEALERIHGLEPGGFGGTFDDFTSDIHPDDRDRVLQEIEQAVSRAASPYHITYRIVRPGGELRWVEAYGEPLLDEQGEVAGMRGVCIDVTSQQSQEREQEAVYAANHALAAATDLDEGLRALTRIICQAFDCAYVEYRDSLDGGRTLHARATWWPPERASDLGLAGEIEVASDRGPAARAWASGMPVWAEDLAYEPSSPRLHAALAAGLKGAFAIPVTAPEGVIGVLVAFTESPLRERGMPPSLDALAAEVGQFVRRLSAEQALRVRERQQAAVAELGRRALASTDRDELLGEAIRVVSETLDVEYAKVLQLLPGGRELRLVAGVGWSAGVVGRATVSAGTESQAGYTLHADGPVIVNDLREERRFSGPPLLHEHGVVSGVSTVIRGNDGPWGILGAHTKQVRAFTRDNTLFLEAVANVVATAIDRDGRERSQEFLLHANEVLFTSLDYRATLTQLAGIAVTEVADWCLVYLLDDAGQRQPLEIAHRDPERVELVQRYREQLSRDESRPRQPNVVDRAIETGETQLIPRITSDDLRNADLSPEAVSLLEQLEIRALAVAPLRARERTLGAILLVSAESGYHYGQTEAAMVEELARRAAIAIDNAQLYEQTREALQTREDFVSIASHELRSPLTSVVGYSARLLRTARHGRLDAETAESIEVIAAEAERMQQTLELFLDMAGLDTGRFTTDIEPTDLGELVAQVTDSLRRRHSPGELHIRLPEEEVVVETDPSRVQTIVSNLISNAEKYGGDPLHIAVTLEQREGGAAVRVRDNGRGIPEADRAHIFDRFYRGSQAHADGRRRGLGLGLHIAKQIADRLGARLWFETEEGAGTEFILELPRRTP